MIKKYIIKDKVGLHARPASRLVDAANKFEDEINIFYNKKEFTLKSILGVLSLGVSYNEEIAIEVIGENSDTIFEALEKVMIDNNII